MEIVAYGGWSRCARMVSGETELLVTLEVGPRVIRLGRVGGTNAFVENLSEMGRVGDPDYLSYGGHRLWIAPEIPERTFQPDNFQIEAREESGWSIFTTLTDKWHLQKEIRIRPSEPNCFQLEHRIYNRGAYTVEVAAWSLTQLAVGGTAYFPLQEFKHHHEQLAPARPIVLWGYSDLADSRFMWSHPLASFSQDPTRGPQKIGSFVAQGFAAYQNHGDLFIKSFPAINGKRYPDFGCNFETFSNEHFLELEALSPVTVIESGEFVRLPEAWKLIGNFEDQQSVNSRYDLIASHAPVLP